MGAAQYLYIFGDLYLNGNYRTAIGLGMGARLKPLVLLFQYLYITFILSCVTTFDRECEAPGYNIY